MGKIALTDFATHIKKNENYQKTNNFASCNLELQISYNKVGRVDSKIVIFDGHL